MAVIFSSTFNTGTFVDWDDVGDKARLIQRGCQRTYCMGCCQGGIVQTGGAAKGFGLIASGAFRLQYAAANNRGSSGLIAGIVNPISILGSAQFAIGVGNGGEITQYSVYGDPEATLAPLGTITLDGSWHAIQILFTITAGTHMGNPANFGAFDAYVNNVLVGSLSGRLTSLKVGVNAMPTGVQGVMVSPINTSSNPVRAIDNVQVDNVAAPVNWLPCDTDPFVTCAEPHWATVTGLDRICPLTQLVITGSGFLDGAEITVTGPDGNPVTFTLVSLSPTQIVLQLTPPFVNGAYCVTVENP